jgi:hypothetical protein
MTAMAISQISGLAKPLSASAIGSFGLAGAGDLGDGHERNRDHRNGADRQGLADDGRDGAGEQRQQVPGLGRDLLRHRDHEPDQQCQANGDGGWKRLGEGELVHDVS